MRKMMSFLLVLSLLLALGGCVRVGDIAEDVAAAAMQELENQVKATLEEHKLEVVEMKTAFGALNDDGGKLQFFCAVLIRCETESMVEGCAKAMDAGFEETGYMRQTESKVASEHLTKKEIVFDHTEYTDATYYLVYGYTSAFADK